MSTEATITYETLYRLASKKVEHDLFGASTLLAQEACQRASLGTQAPILWFEIPLTGQPRFDLHVAYSNEGIHEHAPFASDAMDGHGELLNWYASAPREGGGIALAYDVGEGRIEAPAVHVNVNAANAFDAEGFFAHVGRSEAAVLYHDFVRRLPQGWHVWYFGVHPGRPGAPVRVDCFVEKELKRTYAANPARLEEDFQNIGFAVEGPAVRSIGAEVAASPFGMELQFDILPDETLGQTVGISAQLPLVPASTARPLWEPGGAAARLMEFAVNSHVADARWQHIPDTMFSKAVQNSTVSQALYCIPLYAKFRVRADKVFDTKIYLQSGRISL